MFALRPRPPFAAPAWRLGKSSCRETRPTAMCKANPKGLRTLIERWLVASLLELVADHRRKAACWSSPQAHPAGHWLSNRASPRPAPEASCFGRSAGRLWASKQKAALEWPRKLMLMMFHGQAGPAARVASRWPHSPAAAVGQSLERTISSHFNFRGPSWPEAFAHAALLAAGLRRHSPCRSCSRRLGFGRPA